MKIGSKIKNFTAEMTGDEKFKLSSYKGENLVIYFVLKINSKIY